jgi:hypothetical protein
MLISKKSIPVAILLFLSLTLSLYAQDENPGEIPTEPDWIDEDMDLNAGGDKIFSMNLGVLFPVLFLDNKGSSYQSNINLGGTGSLAFFYFLSSHWFLGGEVQGMFAPTLGENMTYIIPIGVRGGYQFSLGRFEFPLGLMIGMYTMTLLDSNYLGLFVKPEVSAYFRLNQSWSFGINTGWWFVPQWPSHVPTGYVSQSASDYNRYGNFIELSISARYHF